VMTGFCNILEKFYPDSVEKQSLALEQLTQFRGNIGLFCREMKTAAKTMPAHTWWSTFGGGVPELQNVAVKVLSQVNATLVRLRAKDWPSVPTWRLEQDSHPQPFGQKVTNLPMSRHAR